MKCFWSMRRAGRGRNQTGSQEIQTYASFLVQNEGLQVSENMNGALMRSKAIIKDLQGKLLFKINSSRKNKKLDDKFSGKKKNCNSQSCRSQVVEGHGQLV